MVIFLRNSIILILFNHSNYFILLLNLLHQSGVSFYQVSNISILIIYFCLQTDKIFLIFKLLTLITFHHFILVAFSIYPN